MSKDDQEAMASAAAYLHKDSPLIVKPKSEQKKAICDFLKIMATSTDNRADFYYVMWRLVKNDWILRDDITDIRDYLPWEEKFQRKLEEIGYCDEERYMLMAIRSIMFIS